ncbi:hypothetical protein JHK85_052511 [Glycine max]|nr:hypothetical protein JHK85_052511 [Glycine max]
MAVFIIILLSSFSTLFGSGYRKVREIALQESLKEQVRNVCWCYVRGHDKNV